MLTTFVLLLSGHASMGEPPAARYVLEGARDARVDVDVAVAWRRIESFFGGRFSDPVRIFVAADRKAFDAALPAAWGLAPTQCWMVGSGVADALYLLSPQAWARDACEHDASDGPALQGIITHELVHAFHGQRNPTRDFTGMDDVAWFIEGLAVHVAGQMPREASARDAIAAGAAPGTLGQAWEGRYRYGVSGSMVAYIDATYGRARLARLLDAVSTREILARLGLDERQFLDRWRAWVVRQDPG